MGYKERQPAERKVIRHGKNKGRVDMSSDPLAVKAPEGGKVNVEELLQAVRQVKPSNKNRRYKGPTFNP